MNTKEILLAAAERIETNGWFANQWNTAEGVGRSIIHEPPGTHGECAWLAISRAVRRSQPEEEAACEAVCRYLNLPLEGRGWTNTLIYWNNRQTSREVVLTALRGAAAEL